MIGETHGHYHITERIGAGGMGEVYRATDTRLKRAVAIKVLPTEVAQDPERLARFQREAELLASLSHPHIAAIFGLEEADGKPLLVLELIEGEDLSERLKHGSIPADEALEVARQIAEALEEAHERGIVHRDLKPANIKLTPEGKVKVLDFGLAKGWELDPISGGSGDLSRSPTMAYSGTQAGVILGTAAYMSPEQARGKTVDRRADIWAFGVVLYEMLVGGALFGGETATDVIASVVKEQPDWKKLPEETPRVLRSLLRRCLVKDPRQRLRDIGDARIEIERALAGAEGEPEPAPAGAASGEAPGNRPGRAPWVVAAGCALAAAALGVALALKPAPELPVVRFDVPPPEGGSFALNSTAPGPVRVSPDGSMLAYTAVADAGGVQLFVRALDESEARALPGTEGAEYPFWSPDSRHIGFFADRKLKRVEAAGGPPLNLCDVDQGKGGSWGSQGVIVFAPSFNTPIHRISDAGGEPTPVTVLDETRKDDSHRHPRFLPDGRRFLYVARHPEGPQQGQYIVAGSIEGEASAPDVDVIVRTPAAVEYADGHLFFLRDETLMVQPFDADRLELTGEARPAVDPVALIATGTAHAVFSASPGGVLAWRSGGGDETQHRLVWRDREGQELATVGDPVRIGGIRLSPDGEHALATVYDEQSGRQDLWVYEMARGLGTRFTFNDAEDTGGIWSPDGQSVTFASNRGGPFGIYRKALAGTTEEELLFAAEKDTYATGWHPDGEVLALMERGDPGGFDVTLLRVEGDPTREPFLTTPFFEYGAVFSPDGRWIAYGSNESGEWHVYVQPYPGPGRKWQVSTRSGVWPQWTRGGREILYLAEDGTVMSAAIEVRGESLVVGAAEALFKARPLADDYRFAVSPDPDRLLVFEPLRPAEGMAAPPPLRVLVNWPADLERN